MLTALQCSVKGYKYNIKLESTYVLEIPVAHEEIKKSIRKNL
jgi:hypothetical protein